MPAENGSHQNDTLIFRAEYQTKASDQDTRKGARAAFDDECTAGTDDDNDRSW